MIIYLFVDSYIFYHALFAFLLAVVLLCCLLLLYGFRIFVIVIIFHCFIEGLSVVLYNY